MSPTIRFLSAGVMVLLSLSAFAQSDSAMKLVNLDEFVYKSGKRKSKKYKVRIDHVTMRLLPQGQGGYADTMCHLTHFPAIANKVISIYEVQCRLDEYEVSDMSMFLIFLQVHAKDTIIRRVSLDRDKIKHHRTKHLLTGDEVITVAPGEFYLGYGYLSKASKAIDTRLYCSAQYERAGARLILKKGKFDFFPVDNYPDIFPFSIRYY